MGETAGETATSRSNTTVFGNNFEERRTVGTCVRTVVADDANVLRTIQYGNECGGSWRFHEGGT
jgi:hypothetical protein